MPSTQVIRNHRFFSGATREGVANSPIRAGHLAERVAGGLDPQSTDAAVLDTIVVATDARGRGYEAGDEYEADETTPYAICSEGDLLTLFLAAGESVTGGEGTDRTQLVPDGNGGVRAYDSANDDAGAIIALADETIDNSGGGSAVLCNAEVTR